MVTDTTEKGLEALITNALTGNGVKGGAKVDHLDGLTVSMTSKSVLPNWPAQMSLSPHGECDFDPERIDETPGSEQPTGGALDAGPSIHAPGCNPPAHEAYPGGLPGRKALPPSPMATGTARRPTKHPRPWWPA